MLRVTNPTVTLSVGVTVRVVRNGDYERQGRVVSVLINDLIQVNKRLYLSITNDVNVYAGATTKPYTP